jgi:two-component system, NtrC family, response regulator AtoC
MSGGVFTVNSEHLRVLVVEDELLIRWSIAESLTQAGHEVVEAETAASAVRELSSGTDPDVVLLDLRLPDSSDLTLLTNVRRLSPRSAVVLMTAFGTPEVTAKALDLGAAEVLDKPFDIHLVEPTLRRAYRGRNQDSRITIHDSQIRNDPPD